MVDQRTLIAPETNIENQHFWEAASDGIFLIKYCNSCDQAHYYPRALCPHCLSADTVWKESTGKGEIYSFSVMRRVSVPFAIAYVKLDEGITVMTNLVNADLDALRIGQRVSVTFVQSDTALKIPVFSPDAEGGSHVH